MWQYVQGTGQMYDPSGNLLATGYSGAWDGQSPAGGDGDFRNKPEAQCEPDKGPLPAGDYTIGPAHTDLHKGPVVMRLEPYAGNAMCHRAGFLIHGDKKNAPPGSASNGCIILPHDARLAIDANADRHLRVVAAPANLVPANAPGPGVGVAAGG
jgi:hypothetical protein